MHDLAGKNFIVTGANTGIGKVTATELARRGAHVILANRSKEKSQDVIAEITRETDHAPELIHLDLGDLASVRRAAEEILAKDLSIHGLINNAGLAGQRGRMTKDGFELAFGTNHLGHYLFTRLLLDRIVAAPGARIVNVASGSHYQAKKIDWATLREPTHSLLGLREYEVSKLANVLFTKELARQLERTRVTVYAVHPGRVATDAWRRMPAPLRWAFKKTMLTPAEGARSTLRTATDPVLAGETGRYYTADGTERPPSRLALDADLAVQLWRRSAEWTGLPA